MAVAALALIGVLRVASAATPSSGPGTTVDEPPGVDVERRVLALANRSPDLRIRLLSSYDFVDGPRGIPKLQEQISIQSLVEQARGSTDPLVLSLLLFRCGLAGAVASNDGPCDVVDIARRWTVADTQNQVAWLALVQALHRVGDTDGARTAFRRAAEASTWREPHTAIARLVASWLSREAGIGRGDAFTYAIGKAAAVPAPVTYQTIGDLCKGAPERQQACARIVETMARDCDELFAVTVAAAYAARTSLPPATVEAIRREADALYWSMSASSPSGADVDAGQGMAEVEVEAIVTLGERRYYRRLLERAGVGEAEAAKRYVASLSKRAIAQRTDVESFVSMPRVAGW